MNQIDLTVCEKLDSVWAQTEENSSWKVQTCLGHWSLEFGYYLLFAIWSLEFFIFKGAIIIKVC